MLALSGQAIKGPARRPLEFIRNYLWEETEICLAYVPTSSPACS